MTDGNDHDTVVVKDSGSSAGMILGILAVIIVLAGLWYFAMGPGSSGGGTTTQENNPDVNIEVPVEPVEPACFVIRSHHLDDAPDDVGRVVHHHGRP